MKEEGFANFNFGGFGDLAEDNAVEKESEKEPEIPASAGFGGFGDFGNFGGFGDLGTEPIKDNSTPVKEEPKQQDDFGGFGGFDFGNIDLGDFKF